MATPYRVRFPTQQVINCFDGTQHTSFATARVVMDGLRRLCQSGNLWAAAGVPSGGTGVQTGSMCVDYSNKELYLYDAASWNKITLA